MKVFTKNYSHIFILIFLICINYRSLAQTINTNIATYNSSGCQNSTNANTSVNVTGRNLTTNINVTVPAGFEVSKDGISFSNNLILNQVSGNVDFSIILRLATSATVGSLSGNLSLTSTGVTTNIPLSGTINSSPTLNIGTVNSITESATSFQLPYSYTGTANIYSVYTGSVNPLPGFNSIVNQPLPSSPITIPIPSTGVGSYDFKMYLVNNTTSCTSIKNFNLQVTAPVISSDKSTVSPNGCNGQSTGYQSFIVTGSYLTGNVSIIPPSGVELSLDGLTFSNSITLTPVSGTVNKQIDYHLVPTTPAGNVSGNITLSSPGAPSVNIVVNGTQYAAPTINLGTISSVLTTSTSFTIPYTTGGNASIYDVLSGSSNKMPGFTNVNYHSLPTTPSGNIIVPIPQSVVGNYNFGITVTDGTCYSQNVPFTLQVNVPPTVTLSTNALTNIDGCSGAVNLDNAFSITGSNLTGNVTFTAPSGVELTDDRITYSSTLSEVPVSGSLNKTLYARLTANGTPGPVSGNISISSANLTTQNIAVSGTLNQTPVITIGTINPINTASTSFNLSFTIVGPADNITIIPTAPNPIVGSFNLFYSLSASTMTIPIPIQNRGTYKFLTKVYSSASSGCPSPIVPFNLKVNSNIADLSKFDISYGGIMTTYSPVDPSYSLSASNSSSIVTIAPVTADPNATIKINSVPAISGVPVTIPMLVGINNIQMVVTAEDGITVKTYNIAYTRNPGLATINAFAPTSGSPGTTITFTGTNFNGATDVTFGGKSAASFTVVSDNVITAVVAHYSASGNVQIFTPTAGTAVLSGFVYSTVLPITFVSVKANSTSNGVSLQWQMADALDAKQFTIERSVDGINFSKVGTIMNNNSTNYSWIDIHPLKGVSFYRIKAQSQSLSDAIYSAIVKTSIGNENSSISIYPNPVSGKTFRVILNGFKNGNYNLQIISLSGKMVYQKNINCNEDVSGFTIDLPKSVSSGVYNLKVTSPDKTVKSIPLIITSK